MELYKIFPVSLYWKIQSSYVTINCIFVCCWAQFGFLVAFATTEEWLNLLALSKGKKGRGCWHLQRDTPERSAAGFNTCVPKPTFPVPQRGWTLLPGWQQMRGPTWLLWAALLPGPRCLHGLGKDPKGAGREKGNGRTRRTILTAGRSHALVAEEVWGWGVTSLELPSTACS